MTPLLLCLALLLSPQAVTTPDDGFLEVVVPARPRSVAIRLTSTAPAMVAEQRRVALQAGINRLRFDWSRERLDEGSLRFAVEPGTGTAAIRSRTKVHNRGKMLYYDVEASAAGEALVTTRYLLQGLGWRVDYVGQLVAAEPPADGAGGVAEATAPAETLSLRLAVEITNSSGKELEDAAVAFDGGAIEGFSLRTEERRQVEVFQADGIPVRRRYVWDPARFGAAPGIELELRNERDGPLARPLLPAGRIRVFGPAQDGRPGLLGEDVLPATPLGAEARFYLGHARDLPVERKVVAQVNENERRDRWNKVVAHDQRVRVQFKVRNGFDRDVTLTLVERAGAPVEVLSCSVPWVQKKAGEIELTAALPAGQETVIDLEWARRNLF